MLCGQDRARGGFLCVAQNGSNLGGRLLGLLGKAFDLLGHDREAFTLIASFCCFNGSVDGEQVRLFGQVVHRGDDFADSLALFA